MKERTTLTQLSIDKGQNPMDVVLDALNSAETKGIAAQTLWHHLMNFSAEKLQNIADQMTKIVLLNSLGQSVNRQDFWLGVVILFVQHC